MVIHGMKIISKLRFICLSNIGTTFKMMSQTFLNLRSAGFGFFSPV